MKRIISALVLVTAATLGVAGCGGDDDDDSANTGGTGGSGVIPNGGEPAATGGDASPSGGAPTGNVMCDPTEKGVCQNDMDCPFVVDGTARITAGTCGQGCIGKAETCSRDCIVMMLDMSAECASCYADTVNCTIMNCLAECIGDPEAQACKQCQVDKGCRAAFDECSGLPPG
jgi:hypothetical protein